MMHAAQQDYLRRMSCFVSQIVKVLMSAFIIEQSISHKKKENSRWLEGFKSWFSCEELQWSSSKKKWMRWTESQTIKINV